MGIDRWEGLIGRSVTGLRRLDLSVRRAAARKDDAADSKGEPEPGSDVGSFAVSMGRISTLALGDEERPCKFDINGWVVVSNVAASSERRKGREQNVPLSE